MTDLAHDTAEDGFHEIQLSGKQLVALFIVTTTVIVVVFLCGVKVGRGARDAQLDEPEQVAAAAPAPQPAPAVATAPPPAAPAPRAAASAPASDNLPTSGKSGVWAVQVIATRDRDIAGSVVKRLVGKGYPAFLVNPPAGASPAWFKVHVGRYADRGEAEKVSTRIKKEEQFQSWITR